MWWLAALLEHYCMLHTLYRLTSVLEPYSMLHTLCRLTSVLAAMGRRLPGFKRQGA